MIALLAVLNYVCVKLKQKGLTEHATKVKELADFPAIPAVILSRRRRI